MNKFIAIDIETTGLDPRVDSIVGISYCTDKVCDYTTNIEKVRNVLQDESVQKIFHNAVFDISFLQYNGYVIKGQIHDTMLLAHLLDPDRETIKLKPLSREILGINSTTNANQMEEWLKSNNLDASQMYKAPKDLLTEYAKEDAKNTFSLFKVFCQKMRSLKQWLNERSFNKTPWDYYLEEATPLIQVLVNMQLRGVKVDLESIAGKQIKFQQRVKELETILNKEVEGYIVKVEDILYRTLVEKKKAKNKSGILKKEPPRIIFNWDSNNHLKLLFFDVLKEVSTKKTYKGNFSIDSSVLETKIVKYPWIKYLLEYKELKKLSNTYLDNLIEMQKGGRIYAHFNITGTTTGRLSSNQPNLQNIPKHGGIKELFIPEPNNIFIYADYSQLELRLAAHLSQDPLLLKAYINGIDLHQLTANALQISRDLAKTVNFAIIYNASGYRLKEILNLKTPDEGNKIKDKLFKQYSGLKTYLDNETQKMLKYGMSISPFGRIRRLEGLRSLDKKVYSHALKSGFNMPIQSMGASLCKRAMIKLYEKGYRIVNQVHDSIIIECDKRDSEQSLKDIKEIMENIVKLSVPLIAEPKYINSFENNDEKN